MKKPQIKRDGEKFYVDTSAGRVSADEVGGLSKLAMRIEENRPRPPEEFLAAWQDGIRLAGEHLYQIQSDSVESATDRDQLRPDHEVIVASLGGMSPSQGVFVLSLDQFFSDSTVRDLCDELEYPFPSLTDIANLDAQYRSAILRLLSSYSGW